MKLSISTFWEEHEVLAIHPLWVIPQVVVHSLVTEEHVFVSPFGRHQLRFSHDVRNMLILFVWCLWCRFCKHLVQGAASLNRFELIKDRLIRLFTWEVDLASRYITKTERELRLIRLYAILIILSEVGMPNSCYEFSFRCDCLMNWHNFGKLEAIDVAKQGTLEEIVVSLPDEIQIGECIC